MLRIERHGLGPRIYFRGVRLHEWHLGAAILLALGAGALGGVVHDTLPAGLAAVAGVWLIAKDWQDLVPSRRDTAAWRLGLHRRPAPLRALSRAEPLPTLVALAAAAVAVVNLVSALTPNVAWRGHLLVRLEPIAELRVFHALVVPASLALLVAAFYLYRRRLRALQLAVVLLLALAALNLLKGLDFEEAAADAAAAVLLWLGRGSFYVQHEPVSLRSAVWRIPFVAAAGFGVSWLVVLAAVPSGTSLGTVTRATGDFLLWQPGPVTFHDELGRLDLAVGLVGLLALLAAAYLLFRPLAAPRSLPEAEAREAAVGLVRAHGDDTLAYFKLRRDKHYLFSPDGRALAGYRVESGVLIVSGDPVGPPGSLPPLLRELSRFAERRGLRIAALGVSERMRPLFEQLGLRSLYIGDEAIVETGEFSLEGRAIRKVRQSVSRLEREGYRAELLEVASLDAATLPELERVSAAWRAGTPERGFSMALDTIRQEDHGDTLLVLARDGEGRVRAFLHFVPSFGRPAMSLSFMRRERDTPNGLTEFLVVKAIEFLRAGGVEEVSLNFAAFARLLHSPRGRLQRVLGRALTRADALFQIESLYRFNAKFYPRWEPRYFLFERMLGFPRAGLAALWVEGQLPKPLSRRRGQPGPREPRRSRRASR